MEALDGLVILIFLMLLLKTLLCQAHGNGLMKEPISVFDLRFTEGTATATITATLGKAYSEDVVITLSTAGTATVTEDYTLSSETITVSSGSTGTSTITIKDDSLDEDDKDTVRIEVASVTYALETVDQKILLAIEDDDDMPSVTLTASEDTISEAGGTSNLTATISTVSGRDVKVGLSMGGTAGAKDFTVDGNEIDVSEILTEGLVLNYTFSGDANDGTSNGNDGNSNNVTLTKDRFGEDNSAMYFDGSNSYIQVPFSESLQIKEDITLSAWVKRSDDNNDWTHFIIRAPGEYYEMRVERRDNNNNDNSQFHPYGRAAASYSTISSTNIDNDKWVMLTFTSESTKNSNGDYTSSKSFKFYIDGELQSSSSYTGNRYDLSTNENLMIGSSSNGNNNNFSGSMDEIRIYNKALTAQEISILYDNSSVQKTNATISIAKGSTTGSVEIKGTDDETDESAETLIAKVVSTTGATETGDQEVSIVITDNDSTAVNLSVSSDPITEGYLRYATVTATLDKVSELPVTVTLKSSGVDSTDYYFSEKSDTSNVVTLAAHYTFSGDVEDNSGNDNKGTVTGATFVEDRFGNAKSSVYFDGINDYITVPYEGNLRIEEEMTMSLWINVDADGSRWHRSVINAPNNWYFMYVNTWDDNSDEQSRQQFRSTFSAGGYGNEINLDCGVNGNNCNERPKRGVWQMITYTLASVSVTDSETGEVNQALKFYAYLDGQLYEERLITDSQPNKYFEQSGNVYIGNSEFKGKLDDVRIYKGALSSDQVKELYELEKLGQDKLSNSISISPGNLTSDIYVFAGDDNIFGEGNEILTLTQESVSNGYVGDYASVNITIQDNDIIPSASINSTRGFEITEGTREYIQVRASLDSVTTRDLTVKLKTSGKASNEDYTVSINPNDTSTFKPLQGSELSGVWTLVEENDDAYHTGININNRYDYVSSSYRMSNNQGNGQYPGNSDLWSWADGGGDSGSTQSCMMDDAFTFGEDGAFRIELGTKTNIWTSSDESCAAPVAPFVSGTNYSYEILQNYQLGTIGSDSDSSSGNSSNPTYDKVIKLKGKGAHFGWSSGGTENSEERYYGYRVFGPNNDYLLLDEFTTHPNLSNSWIRYVYTRRNTSYSPNKSITGSEISQTIIIPAGQKQVDAYIFAIDDEVVGEGNENLVIEIDEVINGKETTTSVNGSIRDNDIKPSVTLTKDSGSEVKEGSSQYIQLTAEIDSVTTVPVTVILKSEGDAVDNDYFISDNPDDTVSSSDISTQDSFAPGRWSLRSNMSAYGVPIGVGPERGNTDWWGVNNPESEWGPYSCMGDDYVQFGAINPQTGRGIFSMNLGATTGTYPEQVGGVEETCGSPVAPYLSGNYEYEIRYGDPAMSIPDTLILYGEGAYLGISKVNNNVEFSVESEKKYLIQLVGDEMIIDIS